MNSNKTNLANKKPGKGKRRQPRKDSKVKRVNFDNTRESKFIKDVDSMKQSKGKDKYNDKNDNDWKWYAGDPELLKSSCSYPTFAKVGDPTPWGSGSSIPGALTFYWKPNLAGAPLEAINQVKDMIYSNVVHANSRNTSYDANDLMILLLGGSQVFAAMGWIFRLYGVLKKYNPVDKFTPSALVYSMGVDFDDCIDNLSNMWFDINQMVAMTRQIWIPKVFPVTERWFWMNSNIYIDSASPKAQFYMYNPVYFLQYDDKASNQGGLLRPLIFTGKPNGTLDYFGDDPQWHPQPFDTLSAVYNSRGTESDGSVKKNLYTWGQIKRYFYGLINALVSSTDRGVIFGDILKAYGAENLFALPSVTADYQIEYTYSPEVLSQFENAIVAREIPNMGIMQDMNYNVLKPIAFGGLSNSVGLSNYAVLNFHQVQDPTPEQIMVATRCMVLDNDYDSMMNTDPTALSVNDAIDTACRLYKVAGSEIICDSMEMRYNYKFTNISDDSKRMTMWGYDRTLVMSDMGLVEASDFHAYVRAAGLSPFDWHPFVYVIDGSTGIPNLTLGDYDNYTFVDKETLKKSHVAACLSLFGVTGKLSI